MYTSKINDKETCYWSIIGKTCILLQFPTLEKDEKINVKNEEINVRYVLRGRNFFLVLMTILPWNIMVT